MQAIRLERTGGPEVLELKEVPIPEPGAGQIRVRHEAIGVNFIDTYYRRGGYPIPLPSGLGSEGAGVVDAVGPDVTRFAVGDRTAYAMSDPGSYAQYHCVSETRAVRLPDAISAPEAAAGLLKGLTAEMLLRRCAPIGPGDTVLVHAAAGGVGSILVPWAKAIGATVIGTAGTAEKAALATRSGCDHVILYREDDVAGRVREITGGAGVRVVYDSVGAATLDGSLASLARRGILVSFGNASGAPPPVEPLKLMRAGSLYLTRPTLFDYIDTPQEMDEAAEAFFNVAASGAVTIAIGQQWALKDVAEAHRALEARETSGPTILIP